MKVAVLFCCAIAIFIINAIGQTFNKTKLITSSRVMVIGFFLGIFGYYVYIKFLS